jgi:hypothetical protein
VFNRRQIERWTALTDVANVTDETRWIAKKLGLGQTPRGKYLQRYFTGVVDARRNAIHETYDLMRQYQRKIGKEPRNYGFGSTRNMRLAAQEGDYEAFKNSYRAFLAKGGNGKKFSRSVAYLDPLATTDLTKWQKQQFLNEFLNDTQRRRVMAARGYAHDLHALMILWYRRAKSELQSERKARAATTT